MMLVTATRPFHWGRVPAGPGRYYADTTNAGDALQPGYPWVHASDCAPPFPNDLANAIRYGREMRKVLLVRPGGIGDLLFLGVVARAIHGQWQACEVTACVAPPYMAAALAGMVAEACARHPRDRRPEADGIVDRALVLAAGLGGTTRVTAVAGGIAGFPPGVARITRAVGAGPAG